MKRENATLSSVAPRAPCILSDESDFVHGPVLSQALAPRGQSLWMELRYSVLILGLIPHTARGKGVPQAANSHGLPLYLAPLFPWGKNKAQHREVTWLLSPACEKQSWGRLWVRGCAPLLL